MVRHLKLVILQYFEREPLISVTRLFNRILSNATWISQFFKLYLFTMITPALFVYAYNYNLSPTKMFQLLIIVVVMDRMVSAFLSGYDAHSDAKKLLDEFVYTYFVERSVAESPRQ